MWTDIRLAVRALRRSPGFTIAAVLTLALGIGATSSIFSVFDTVLLRPLPFADADRLYVVHEVIPARVQTMPLVPVNALHFRAWRDNAHSFDALALIAPDTMTVTGAGEPAILTVARVSPELSQLLGLRMGLGRSFAKGDDEAGRGRVAILSHDLWTTRFGSDPRVVGRTITLDGTLHEVVGVLAPGAVLPNPGHLYGITADFGPPQLWTPFIGTPRELRLDGAFNFVALGKLRSGVTAAQATSELDAIQAEMAKQTGPRAEYKAALVPLQEQMAARSQTGLELLLGAVAMVLLIGCVNIANLLLARSTRREQEFAIRRANGAGTGRLLRQMLMESLVLSIAGGAAGVALAVALLRVIVLNAPPALPRVDEIAINLRLLVFSTGVSLASGLAIGLIPAWRAIRIAPLTMMQGAARSTAGSGAGRVRSLLVGAEVAISTVCVIAATLLLNSFVKLLNVDRGFDVDRVATVSVLLPPDRYPDLDQGVRLATSLAERVRALPGVTMAAATDRLPLTGVSNSGIMVEGSNQARIERPTAFLHGATPEYFAAVGTPLIAGRLFQPADADRPVAVVSTLAAQRLWPGQSAIGKRFRSGPDDSPMIEVIGIVADTRHVSLSADPPLNIYFPLQRYFYNRVALVFRSDDPGQVAAGVRAIVRDLDPQLPAPAVETMADLVDQSVAARRFQMILVLLLAGAAVLLASVGIYGVVSQMVSQRTNEFGIRMALGAQPGSVRRLVLAQSLMPVGAGLVAGLAAALQVGSVLRSLLFGVTPYDPMAIGGAVAVLLTVALASSYLPARRATRIEPIVALRYE